MGDEHYYVIRGGLQGRERLRVLGRVMRPTTLPVLERAGVTAGMRVLDLGCGGGDVTFDLASLVGLTGHAVGMDVDATKIATALADAEQVGRRAMAEIRRTVSAMADGTAYDVVYARFVLTHLHDPVAAVAQMRRALRPGGRLVVEDIDFRGSFCEPEHAAFERYEEIYVESARRNGGDPWIGLRIPAMLVDAGFARVLPNVVQPAELDGESKLMPALTLENIKETVLRHGVASEEEIDGLVDELYALAADPRTYVANPRIIQVIGEKLYSRTSAASSHSTSRSAFSASSSSSWRSRSASRSTRSTRCSPSSGTERRNSTSVANSSTAARTASSHVCTLIPTVMCSESVSEVSASCSQPRGM